MGIRGPSACHSTQWMGAASPSSNGSRRRRAGFCAPANPTASVSKRLSNPRSRRRRPGFLRADSLVTTFHNYCQVWI